MRRLAVPIRARVLALALPLLLPACGSDRGAPGDAAPLDDAVPSPEAAAPEPPGGRGQVVEGVAHDPCTLLSVEEVNAAAGMEATAGQPSTSGGAQVCTWTDAAGRTAVVQVHPSAAWFDQSLSAFESMYDVPAEEIWRLSDEAYFIGGHTGPLPTATIGLRREATSASAQVMAMEGSPEELRGAALELARRVVEKL